MRTGLIRGWARARTRGGEESGAVVVIVVLSLLAIMGIVIYALMSLLEWLLLVVAARREGVSAAPSSRLSNPMTATSRGTERPAARSACIAPNADSSLLARTAVNGCPASMLCRIADWPPL